MLAERVERLRSEWQRRVVALPLVDGPWRVSRAFESGDPIQGWKLHVSATVLNASEVLDRVLPLLKKSRVMFKAPARLEFLLELNSGLSDFSQIGKFLTVYPRNDQETVALARELHARTRGLAGPEIPFDLPYRRNSLVHYRHGVFRPHADAKDASDDFLIDPSGQAHRDERKPGRAVPPWVRDPLASRWSVRAARRSRTGPIGTDFLAFRALSQRGKGGVYEALDLSVSPARLCVIKEGRRFGETLWDGSDGYSKLKHEEKVLRELRKGGVPVPEIIAAFDQGKNRYLVLKKLDGRGLGTRLRSPTFQPSAGRTNQLLEELSLLLQAIRAAGWIWRDCKPSNLVRAEGRWYALDFEGACRPEEIEVIPWGAPEYTPPQYHAGYKRQPGTREDDYAMGVIAFQFATGKRPPDTRGKQLALLKRHGCPVRLRDRILELIS